MRNGFGAVAGVVALLAAAAPVRAGEVERLRAENERLQQRVRQLETENAQLRRHDADGGGLGAALEQRATEAVTVVPGEQPGTRTVETEPSRLEGAGGGKGRHWITWRAPQAADGAAAPGSVLLIVDTAASGGIYRGVQSVQLDVDGTPVDCAVSDYHTVMNTSGRDAGARTEGESVTVVVPKAVLDRLAGAHEVRATVGPSHFRLSPQQIADLRAFTKRLAG